MNYTVALRQLYSFFLHGRIFKEFSVLKNALKIVVVIMLSCLPFISHIGACAFKTVLFQLFSTHSGHLSVDAISCSYTIAL
jgi:hypothetical protein